MSKNEIKYPNVSSLSELYDAQKRGYLFVDVVCCKCKEHYTTNIHDAFVIIKGGCFNCKNNIKSINEESSIVHYFDYLRNPDKEYIDNVDSKNTVEIIRINDVDLLKYKEALSVKRDADIKINPYRYRGLGSFNSECTVQIWKENEKAIVVFTDNGVGTSVTNASEILITEIYNNFLLSYDKNNCLFMETYDKKEAVDIIIPIWIGNTVSSVTWIYMGKVKINKQD